MQTLFFATLAVLTRVWPGNWGGAWPWGLLWLAFAILFWGGLIFLLLWAVRSASTPRRPPDTAMQVLKRRLAAGEITQEEYERIKRLLEE